ncbi:flagellar biosynthesis protein [Sulfobacillus acidophilus TPY]|uniref:Type III secretion exporter n=1 Tax=Sulfobacillus acidophilus (strain ATCC 700253 / DSM 10332 / NAL) TaxID=679936 RepID=G8U1H7_SULAD|nr:flagellar biosynthesis protein [Sulfobacillus acidophilus TPY]AEW06582.1 type III secretion exporter [Sulfobacillus acidophilus DSM 10332]
MVGVNGVLVPRQRLWLMAERTQAPTPRRRQRAREEGKGWFSPDFQAGLAILLAVALLKWYLPWSGTRLAEAEAQILGLTPGPDFALAWVDAVLTGLKTVVVVLMPMVLPMAGIGLLTGLVQNGFHFAWQRVLPDFSRLNPVTGLTRMFSQQGLWLLVKGLLKMGIIGAVVGVEIANQVSQYAGLVVMPLGQALSESALLLRQVLMRAAIAFFAVGLVDLAYQYWQFQQSLKMSVEEVRDELKESEGDPRLKGQRRAMHRRLIRTGLREVKNAQVVITNPTHYAVALKWDDKTMQAPQVIAKGTDEVALAIREVAYHHFVPVVENPPLARSLFSVPLGEAILPEHYQAVADILAYVIARRGGIRR